jgi:hypothetical protein
MLYLVNRYKIAEMLGVSPETVSRMHKRGELQAPYALENQQKPLWIQSDIEDLKAKREGR